MISVVSAISWIMESAVNKVLTDGKYNVFLSLIKGFRNGAVCVYKMPH